MRPARKPVNLPRAAKFKPIEAVPVASAPEAAPFRDAAAEGLTFVRNPTVAMVESSPAGTITSTLPPVRAPKTKYPWDDVRRLLEDHPGLWVLALKEISTGVYSYVRRGGGPSAFIGMGGHLQVSLRDQHDTPNPNKKGRVGDLWLRWIPEGWSEDDQARAQATFEAGEGVL